MASYPLLDDKTPTEILVNSLLYPVAKENGQKKFGPPINWPFNEPSEGSEIFIGHLPRKLTGSELLILFSQAGQIYQLRLMMEFR